MSFPAISDYEIPDDDYNKAERSRVVQEGIDAYHARRANGWQVDTTQYAMAHYGRERGRAKR